MKKFIRKTTGFAIVPVLYLVANMLINYFIYSVQSVPIENAQILIIGDSHPQTSLNPELMKNAQNICQNAEPYVVTHWKLKKILESNTPETVILGFAPHNISQFNDLKFSNSKWSNEMFRRTYPIQNFSEIDNKIDVDFVSFYKTLFKQTAYYPKKFHGDYIGKYSNNKTTKTSDWESSIKRHYFSNTIELGVSEIAISYMDSIVALCRRKNIELVFVSQPVHENYLKNIPNPILSKYDFLVNEFRKKHLVIDKTRSIYADSLFLNSDHLNEYGATKFTNEVVDILNNE